MMRVGEEDIRRRVALALAHLCSPDDQKKIFIDYNGILFIKSIYYVGVLCKCTGTLQCIAGLIDCSYLPHLPHMLAGLALLLELLESTDSKHQRDSSMALCTLASKASLLSSMNAPPPSPIPQVIFCNFGCCGCQSIFVMVLPDYNTVIAYFIFQ